MSSSQPSNLSACISSIREPERDWYDGSQLGRVFPGYVEIRNLSPGLFQEEQEPRESVPRGPIVEFSKGARLRLLKKLLRVEEPMTHWQDFTFADDVMEGLTVGQRAKRAKDIKKRFVRLCKGAGIDFGGLGKWEWVRRKSGRLRGQHVPHLHLLFQWEGIECEKNIFTELALLWVKATKTKEIGKALGVALNPASYRKVTSRKQAQKYLGKYVSKNEGFVADESIGRSYCEFGNLKLSNGEEILVTGAEVVTLKRAFRKIYRKQNRNMRERLRTPRTEFFMIVPADVVKRIVEEKRFADLVSWFDTQGAEASVSREVEE